MLERVSLSALPPQSCSHLTAGSEAARMTTARANCLLQSVSPLWLLQRLGSSLSPEAQRSQAQEGSQQRGRSQPQWHQRVLGRKARESPSRSFCLPQPIQTELHPLVEQWAVCTFAQVHLCACLLEQRGAWLQPFLTSQSFGERLANGHLYGSQE